MKRKMFSALTAAALAASMLLTGCSSSMQVAKVASRFRETLKAQPVTGATAEITADVTLGEESQEGRLRMVVHGQSDWEALRLYSQTDSTLTLPDREIHRSFQSYHSGEKSQYLRYIHIDQSDLWIRAEGKNSIFNLDSAALLKLLDSASDTATAELQENTAGGAASYLLKLVLEGSSLENFLVSSGMRLPQWMVGMSLKDVKIPVEVEIEDKTYLPLQVRMEIQGIDSLLAQALAEDLMLDAEIRELGLDLGIENISVLISNFSYEPAEVPLLPMGAAEKALDLNKLRELQNA